MPCHARASLTTLAALASLTCGGGVAPVTFPAPLSAVPPPGLCRVLSEDQRQSSRLQRCDGIEWEARPGDVVVYRPEDGSRMVVVCYMSMAERGVIDGVDVFDVDTGELIEVIRRHGEPPPEGGCQGALWERSPRP